MTQETSTTKQLTTMTQETSTTQEVQQENVPITLNLDLNSVNFILAALGELPTKSGAYRLMAEIKNQGESQIPAPEVIPEG